MNVFSGANRPWREVPADQIDEAVERIADGRLARYEAGQDRAQSRECPWCGNPCECDEQQGEAA